MIIGFYSDEVESFTIIYIVNKKSDIPLLIEKKLKTLGGLVYQKVFPGRIDKPYIDEEEINNYLDE